MISTLIYIIINRNGSFFNQLRLLPLKFLNLNTSMNSSTTFSFIAIIIANCDASVYNSCNIWLIQGILFTDFSKCMCEWVWYLAFINGQTRGLWSLTVLYSYTVYWNYNFSEQFFNLFKEEKSRIKEKWKFLFNSLWLLFVQFFHW